MPATMSGTPFVRKRYSATDVSNVFLKEFCDEDLVNSNDDGCSFAALGQLGRRASTAARKLAAAGPA